MGERANLPLSPMREEIVPLGSKDTKELVIRVLSEEWPLTAREIFVRAEKSGEDKTYQAIHKTLKQLETLGIVSSEGRRYRLSKEWAAKIKALGETLEKRLSQAPALGTTPSAASELVFGSYIEALYSLLERMVQDYLSNPKPDTTVAHWWHAWPILLVSKKEYAQIVAVLRRGNHYALCANNSPLDRSLLKMWESLGKQYRAGVPCAETCDVLVTRDYVIQIFIPLGVRRQLEGLFKKERRWSDSLFTLYRGVYESKEPTKVIVIKDAALADQLREQTISGFFAKQLTR